MTRTHIFKRADNHALASPINHAGANREHKSKSCSHNDLRILISVAFPPRQSCATMRSVVPFTAGHVNTRKSLQQKRVFRLSKQIMHVPSSILKKVPGKRPTILVTKNLCK
ncbi:hypothetical protein CEXT_693241 [Caerostris extrusa]|uniref:Uncharacterized protein n=1 Tax=Caerostris extrusa TaxID=172846 RepID=A0AAV4QAD8_CAEEX|nr:hypothetical protein CEXT_693241 [Caerostris extrusa]